MVGEESVRRDCSNRVEVACRFGAAGSAAPRRFDQRRAGNESKEPQRRGDAEGGIEDR